MGESKTTRNHNVIRKWVEARGGHPAAVRRTACKSDPGLLRIDFPNYSGKLSLEEISWDEFFQKFDEKGLAFVYQDKTATGRTSRFCKMVNRGTAKARSHTEHHHAQSKAHREANHAKTKPTSGSKARTHRADHGKARSGAGRSR